MRKAFFIGVNALGDTLCTTPAVHAFRKKHPGVFITYIVQNATYCRVLDANPDIDLVLYSEHLWLHGMQAFSLEWLHSLPIDIEEAASLYHFDMMQVCAKAESFQDHIATGLAKLVAIPIKSVRPFVRVTSSERRAAGGFLRKPHAVFGMHSNANPARPDGSGGAKDWPRENWLELARYLSSSHGLDVIAVGSESDARVASPCIRSLYGLPIKVVAALLESASCVVTVENGLAHLSAAVDAPMVELYSNIVPLEWAYPKHSTCCRVLYNDPRLITCRQIIDAVEDVLARSRATRWSRREIA